MLISNLILLSVFSASRVEVRLDQVDVHELFLRERHGVTATVLDTHRSPMQEGFQGPRINNKLKVEKEPHRLAPQVLESCTLEQTRHLLLPHLAVRHNHQLIQSPFQVL